LASRIRVLGTGRSDKNDPNDLSMAIAALRTPGLCQLRPTDHTEVLRLPARRNIDIGKHPTRVVCRLHNALMALAPGGIAKELNASDVVALFEGIEPATPVGQARRPGRRAAGGPAPGRRLPDPPAAVREPGLLRPQVR
jgi:hypothetical protein